MGIIYPHIIAALGELGERELPGSDFNERIAGYLLTVGLPEDDEIPWCSAFVNWCLEEAGVQGTGRANAKSFLNWGYSIAKPATGCIVVFDRGKYKWQGHVGFYLDESVSYVYTLGGNQENKVSIRPYAKDRLEDYRWSSEFI